MMWTVKTHISDQSQAFFQFYPTKLNRSIPFLFGSMSNVRARRNISEETTPKQFPILKFIVKINCTRKNSKCEWLQYFYFAILVRICLDQLCCVLELWELPLGPNLAQVSVSNPKYSLYYWSFVKIWYIVQVNFIDRVGSLVFMFKHTHVFYTCV